MTAQNVVRFRTISRKKGDMTANFRVKGGRNGADFTASISVSIDAANVDPADSLEKIIEECAQIGLREFQRCDFEFEGLVAI